MELDKADEENTDPTTHKLLRAVEDFHTYIENNEAFIPNYGARYRQGERISSRFVESSVNYVVAKRFTKRQQMQWSPKGAHLLLQLRTQVCFGCGEHFDEEFCSLPVELLEPMMRAMGEKAQSV